VLRRFTGDAEAADSLTQEAFLRALRGLGGFRGRSALGTWITRIGLNLALNERRRRREAPLPAVEPAGETESPSRNAERREVRERVRAGLAALPGDLRDALLLTFFAGRTHAEAAAELGCAEGTVSWRVFEAKRRLREVLPDGL
jgi:RNA polymerase sigma-70 factor (ECF subfamily)